MDPAAYHVVYVDSRVSQNLDGKHLAQPKPEGAKFRKSYAETDRKTDILHMVQFEAEEVRDNLGSILTTFNGVYACTSSFTCKLVLAQLESSGTDFQPTLVIVETFVEIEGNGRPGRRSPAPSSLTHSLPSTEHRLLSTVSDPNDHYGLTLIQHISAEIAELNLSKLIVPIAMIHSSNINTAFRSQGPKIRPSRPSSDSLDMPTGSISTKPRGSTFIAPQVNPRQMLKCLDAGAVDVIASPILPDRIYALTAHAYRAHQRASEERKTPLSTNRVQRRSWLGYDHYAFLREDMVYRFVTGICDSDHVPHGFDHRSLYTLDRSAESSLVTTIGSWGFPAHDYSEDQLVHAAFLMLQHALAMPELEKWRLPASDLQIFLLATRAAYNASVHYHNFRHVVDVMQAVFYFLLQLGILPPYPSSSARPDINQRASPMGALLKPFDALTLLVSAIGHDVGHPGVNNAFLVALNAPLAQLYNNKSVLESFHCAAYSQILRRYWKHAFEDMAMRGLLINSILATDMSLHFEYMSTLGNLQTKVDDNKGTAGWDAQELDGHKTLICAVLLKCADISNVARPFDIAARWSDFLQLEFASQGELELKLSVPTTLFGGPPELGNLIKLAHSQIGFMNIFARPLFQAVTRLLPSMVFAVDEMNANNKVWEQKIEQEHAREELKTAGTKNLSENLLFPRSQGESQPELSHPEGLPASKDSSNVPLPLPESSSHPELSRVFHPTSSSFSHASNERPGSSPLSPSHGSRRSSLGLPFSHVSPGPDSSSYSRRSSGASPTANALHPSLNKGRSSNTMLSQLQVSPPHGSRSQASSSVATSENVPPLDRGSEDTLSQPNLSTRTGSAQHSDGGIRLAIDAGSGVGGDTTHRGKKGSEPYTYRSARPSVGGFSSLSSHHRDSSGAHTSMTHSTPYSPTGTQATSFVTADSDGKSLHAGEGWSSLMGKGIPNVVDVERPGCGHKYGESQVGRGNDVKTSVMNGHGSTTGTGVYSGRVITSRKSSRFLNFWKKRGKAMESSP